jgi:hypothetical protein
MEVAGRCVARKPVITQAGGLEGPHAPPAMERERIVSRRHREVTPTDKRKALGIRRVFESRATLFRWPANLLTPAP